MCKFDELCVDGCTETYVEPPAASGRPLRTYVTRGELAALISVAIGKEQAARYRGSSAVVKRNGRELWMVSCG